MMTTHGSQLTRPVGDGDHAQGPLEDGDAGDAVGHAIGHSQLTAHVNGVIGVDRIDVPGAKLGGE